ENIAISRLDYSEGEEHYNGWLVPAHITRWIIRGPHLHRWVDNRGFATHATLPDELEYAIVIPRAAIGFANAFAGSAPNTISPSSACPTILDRNCCYDKRRVSSERRL